MISKTFKNTYLQTAFKHVYTHDEEESTSEDGMSYAAAPDDIDTLIAL